MPVDIATISAFAAMIAPVYAALWHINRQIGGLNVETNVNSDDVDTIADGLDSLDNRVSDLEDDIQEIRG